MITAKIIADSISLAGKRIVTMELEYPRFIHAEFMTHRDFSRNAASSRAIPVAQVIEQVRNNPAMPIHWGKNQPGMQANEEHDADVLLELLIEHDNPSDVPLFTFERTTLSIQDAWREAANSAANIAQAMSEAGYHKQIVNRILEPFQHIKVVVTATEWDNFFTLRAHPDAQPEIHELALQMRAAMEASTPMSLKPGEWHMPYVETVRNWDGSIHYGLGLSVEEAKMVSASCCAQVSYRKLDDSLEKAKAVFQRLVESRPVHASPFEHQAMPLFHPLDMKYSGNFSGWIQHRKLIENQL